MQNRQSVSLPEQRNENNELLTSILTPHNSFSVLEDQAGNVRNDPQPLISEQNLNDDMQIPPNIQIPSPNNEESSPSEQNPIVIIGDSIIKHINPQKLSSKQAKNSHSLVKPRKKFQIRLIQRNLKQTHHT